MYLFLDFRQFLFIQTHPGGKHSHDKRMPSIAKHDSEEKRESDDGVQAGIDFAVVGDSVRID